MDMKKSRNAAPIIKTHLDSYASLFNKDVAGIVSQYVDDDMLLTRNGIKKCNW